MIVGRDTRVSNAALSLHPALMPGLDTLFKDWNTPNFWQEEEPNMFDSDNPYLSGNYAPWREEGDAST